MRAVLKTIWNKNIFREIFPSQMKLNENAKYLKRVAKIDEINNAS